MRNPKLTLVIGLTALIIGGLLTLARPYWLPSIGDRVGDFVLGIFYGLAIGMLLASIHMRRSG